MLICLFIIYEMMLDTLINEDVSLHTEVSHQRVPDHLFYSSQSIVSESFDYTCIYKVLTYRLSLGGWSVEGFDVELLAATSGLDCSSWVASIFWFLGEGSYVSSSSLLLFLSIRSVSIRPLKSSLLCLLELWDVVGSGAQLTSTVKPDSRSSSVTSLKM